MRCGSRLVWIQRRDARRDAPPRRTPPVCGSVGADQRRGQLGRKSVGVGSRVQAGDTVSRRAKITAELAYYAALAALIIYSWK